MPGTPIITICIAHINLAYLTTLFGHVGQFYDHEICQLYPVYSNKLIIFGHYSYIQAALGNLGGVILPTYVYRLLFIPRIFVGNIVHPSIIS